MVSEVIKRLGTHLTAWSDVKFISFMSAKAPKGCRAVVVLIDFRDLAWRLLRMSIVALDHFNPEVPIYLVWTGTPPEGKSAVDRVLELCDGISVDFEILSEGDLLPEIRKLSVKKTRSLTSSA